MKKSLLNLSLQIARKKLYKHPQLNCYIHYSFIIQRNKIVEWATNNSKQPPKHNGYDSRIHDLKFRAKTHAELAAYHRAKGLLDKQEPYDIINLRLNKAGDLRLSKPCVICSILLKELGCRHFYFSSDVGFLKL